MVEYTKETSVEVLITAEGHKHITTRTSTLEDGILVGCSKQGTYVGAEEDVPADIEALENV